MELWEKIRNLWEKRAPSWTYLRLSEAKVDKPLTGGVTGPDQGYVRLRLREMRIVKCRAGFKRMHPLLHSYVRLRYGGKDAEIPVVAGPGQLAELRAGNLENVLTFNHLLLPTTPYAGGDIRFLVGLFAAEYEDHLERFLDFLGSVSNVAGSELPLALKLSRTLKAGIENVLGVGQFDLKLGLHDAVSADGGATEAILPGYRVLAAVKEEELPIDQLCIKNGRLRVDDGSELGVAPVGFDYLVLSLETLSRRDDWQQLASIFDDVKALKASALRKTDEELRLAYTSVAAKVLSSDELIYEDQLRVLATLRKIMADIKALRATGLRSGVRLPGAGADAAESGADGDEQLAAQLAGADISGLCDLSRGELLRPAV